MRYQGLDPQNTSDVQILEKLQGGILNGHGRNQAAFVFARANTVSAVAIRKLADFVPQSAIRQYHLGRQATLYGRVNEPFHSLLISATGYKKLDIDERLWPRDIAFRRGMKHASRAVLGDPPNTTWDTFFQDDVDFLAIVAAEDPVVVQQGVDSFTSILREAFDGNAHFHIIHSQTLRNNNGWPTDVFGFTDGISQPLFLKYEVEEYFSANPNAVWDPSFDPRHLVLTPDLVVSGGFGSYVTFRKLRQDKAAFDASIQDIATLLSVEADFIEAQTFGRFRDGTPLVLHDREQSPTNKPNNFNFTADALPSRCPMHAHIRKANVRSEDPHFLYRMIARRGMPFKSASSDQSEGLLFVCCQQDIGRQFEFQQAAWMNEPSFPENNGEVGCDAVTVTTPRSNTSGQRWLREWASPSSLRCDFRQFVSFQGGEYFYAAPPQFFPVLAGNIA